jgi:catechol 2,3-dioxygenase-like lactoylglutathione lyase family enzyme
MRVTCKQPCSAPAFGIRVLVAGLTLLAAGAAQSQPAPPPAPTGLIVGSGNFFSPIVADLDEAVAFYRAIGFEFEGEPANADANPQLRAMFGLPDARLRWQIGRAPTLQAGVEIVEVTAADGRPVARRMQDPGTVMLTVVVRDVDATLARLKALGAPVVTRGGVPLRIRVPDLRIVVVQDPAGHFVELAEPPTIPARVPATANVANVRVRHTVQDLGTALALYRDGLGLQALNGQSAGRIPPPYFANGTVLAALGLGPDDIYRYAELVVPVSGVVIELIEFKNMRRHAERARLQDYGSTRMQLRVADIDAAAAALVEAGGTFVSTGGRPLELPAGNSTLKVGIVRDPDDLFLVLIQAPPAAPVTPRE